MSAALLVQGSPEWHAARRGKVTASKIAALRARTKSGWAASRKNYAAELICERLTGTTAESYINAAMQWGIDHEPHCADAIEFRLGIDLAPCGFIDHPAIAMAGASPDRLIGTDALAEFKCPNTATHIETLLSGDVDEDYIQQMQWQLACTGRKRALFASFDPRLPERLRLFTRWFERDDVVIAAMEKDVREFLAELEAKQSALSKITLREAA